MNPSFKNLNVICDTSAQLIDYEILRAMNRQYMFAHFLRNDYFIETFKS